MDEEVFLHVMCNDLRDICIAHFGEDRALDTAPIHITVADQKYGLGVSDLKRIDIIKAGWKDDMLL